MCIVLLVCIFSLILCECAYILTYVHTCTDYAYPADVCIGTYFGCKVCMYASYIHMYSMYCPLHVYIHTYVLYMYYMLLVYVCMYMYCMCKHTHTGSHLYT